jgi:N-acetylmuramoyl-L-alanine amidase
MALRRHEIRQRGRWILAVAGLLIVAVALLVHYGLGDAAGTPVTLIPSSNATLARPPANPLTVATSNPKPVAAGTAPGTCLAFSPLKGNRGKTVFVDPGHGGIDIGTSGVTDNGSTIVEKNQTLAVGLDLLALLRDAGYRVVMARTDDRLLIRTTSASISGGALTLTAEHDDTVARIDCANAAQADALVAIHFNGFSDPAVNGAETLYDAARPFSASNLRLAGLTQQAVLARLRALGWAVPDRGVLNDVTAGTPALSTKAAAYKYLLELGPAAVGWLKHPSTMPGVVVEPLFLSHPAEADVVVSTAGREAIAQGLADALNAFFTSGGGQKGSR